MDTQITGSACQQHISQRLSIAAAEVGEGALLQQIVDGGIVEVGNGVFFFRQRTVGHLYFAGYEGCQFAGSRVGKDIAVGHMYAGLVGLDDDPGDNE